MAFRAIRNVCCGSFHKFARTSVTSSVKRFSTGLFHCESNCGFSRPLSWPKSNSFRSFENVKLYSKAATISNPLVYPNPKKNDSSSTKESSSSDGKRKEDAFRRKAMKYTFLAFGTMFSGMACIIIYEWGAPPIDEDGNPVVDEFSDMPVMKAYLFRTYKELVNFNKMVKEPSRDKLLPDPLTEPYYQPPYTLVLEMTGLLVHPDWTYRTGWRFKKRPGVDYFLQQVGPPLFELVIFTSEQGFTAYPILDSLDPNQYIMYRLFRDSTRYMDGHHVKDLSCLNRDLSKVIYIDWDPKSFSLQPGNALMVKKWTGNDDDTTLFDLANMLRTIGTSDVEDVRTVLEYYGQYDDPVAVFKENQRKLQEEEQKRLKESRGKTSSLVSSLTNSLRGREDRKSSY